MGLEFMTYVSQRSWVRPKLLSDFDFATVQVVLRTESSVSSETYFPLKEF